MTTKIVVIEVVRAFIHALVAVWAYRYGWKRGRRMGYSEGWRDGGADVRSDAEAASRPKRRFEAAFREVDSKTRPVDLEAKAKETES